MTTMAERADDGLEELGIVELRDQLGRRLDEAYHHGAIFAIRRNRRRVAVMIPPGMWDEISQSLRRGAHDDGPPDDSDAAA